MKKKQWRKRTAKATLKRKTKRFKRCNDDATRKSPAQATHVDREACERPMAKGHATMASQSTSVDVSAIDYEPIAEPAAENTNVEKHAFYMGPDKEPTAQPTHVDERSAK